MKLESNISRKDEIKNALREASSEINAICKESSDHQFFEELIKGKWSIAENMEHLNVSAKASVKAMGANKMFLRAFGTSNGQSRSHNQLLEDYRKVLSTGMAAPGRFSPSSESLGNRQEIEDTFQSVMNRLIERLDNWPEKDLNKFCIKHPALGKITLREFMFFTVFHTRHHYNAIERMLRQ